MASKNKTPLNRILLTASAMLLVLLGLFNCSKDTRSGLHQNRATSAVKMQELVIGLSSYAKQKEPGFIIIPQNGSQLAFEKGNPDLGFTKYLKAIDGIGIEGLFYNKVFEYDSARVGILRKLKPRVKILVSEFVENDKDIADAVRRNSQEGFVPFIRTLDNYHYMTIPQHARNENSRNVTSMKDVQNYLYLINHSNYKTKENFLQTLARTNHDLIIIDLFSADDIPYSSEELRWMKTKANGGKRLVISYMNIGSAENWRYYWKKSWNTSPPAFIQRKYEGYDNEYWVNFWDKDWQKILYGNPDSYLDKIIKAGFDGVYLDNIEAYYYLHSK